MLTRKFIVYSTIAVCLGLALILLPFYSFGGFSHKEPSAFLEGRNAETSGVEHPTSIQQESYNSEIGALTVSFIVAILAYVLFKRRIRCPDPRRVWVNPY